MYTYNDEFWRYFEKSDEYFLLSGHKVEGPIRNMGLGSHACRVGSPEKGHIEKFIEAVEASIPHVSNTMNGCMYGLDDLMKAELAYFKSEMKNCEKFAWAAFYKAHEKEQYEIEYRALFYLLRIGVATGSYPKIQSLCKQLELQLEKAEHIKRYSLFETVMGWYYIAIQQIGQVAPWLKNTLTEGAINSHRRGLENIVSAKYCLAEKKYPELLALLGQHGDKYGIETYLFGKIGAKVMEAVCQYHVQEKGEAMKALSAAYDLAYPNSLDMIFIEQGNDMRAITGAAMKDGNCGLPREWLEKIHRKSATYAKNIAWVISEYKKDNHLENEIHLTDRELKVLTDLYHGLSRTEIAANQDLSINTVSSALRMIYTKLGAENIMDAIRIAMSLKLLE
jgi:LuxR family maltose regulon positive regulatory protein